MPFDFYQYPSLSILMKIAKCSPACLTHKTIDNLCNTVQNIMGRNFRLVDL